MSLKTFHIVFVTLSTLLALAFGVWSLRFHAASGQASYLALAVGSFAGAVGLVVYGVWFWRKIHSRDDERRRRRRRMHTVPVGILAWALGMRAAEACSACYGQAEGPMIDAARLGVWLLFGLVLLLQLAFVAFFVCLFRRARRHRRNDPAVLWADGRR